MDRTQAFFLSCLTAGFIGLLATLLLGSWARVDKIYKRMFVIPPKPDLKSLKDTRSKGIGTNPDQSPITVLTQGCLTIVSQVLLQIGLITAIAGIIVYILQQELPEGSLGGVIFAAAFGFLWQNIRKNWKVIVTQWKLITNPPNPTLRQVDPPNSHQLTANPASPAFSVVVDGLIEIGLRLILEFVLFYLLYQSISIAFNYLSNGVVQVSLSGAFGT
jgi:hypothetical protein